MAVDITQLSTEDLTALQNKDLQSLSDEGLAMLSGNAQPQPAPMLAAVTPSFNAAPVESSVSVNLTPLETREQLQQTNPVLLQEIDDMGGLEAFLVGSGGGFANLLQGVNLMQEDDTERENFEALTNQRGSAAFGELAGETAPFITPGTAAARISSTPLRVAALSSLGATEGATATLGRGGTGTDALITGGVTGILTGITGGFIRAPMSQSQKDIALSIELGRPSRTVRRLREVVDSPNATPEDIARVISQGDDHPITNATRVVLNGEVKSPSGNVVDDVRNILDESSAIANQNKTAEYIVDGAGRVVSDPNARSAIRQGFDPGIVAAVKGSSKADVSVMRNMLGRLKKGLNNRRFFVENRPTDLIGDNAMKRVNFVLNKNREAGKQIDKISRGLRGKSIDINDAVGGFINKLEQQGISFTDEGLDYTGSIFEGLKEPQALLNNVYNRVLRGGEIDARDAHMLKKFIDEQVVFGKSAQGVGGSAENIVKSLRRGIDGALDETYPDYRIANEVYADTIGALDDFQRAVGTTIDLSSPNANKSVGTALRRLLSNAQSRVKQMDSLNELQRVGNKYGADFNDDIMTQMMFANELEEVFGPMAPTSLAGEVAKAGEAAARATAFGRGGEAAAAEAGTLGINLIKNMGKSQDKALQAMEQLLSR